MDPGEGEGQIREGVSALSRLYKIDMEPRPLGAVVYRESNGEVVHFDFLHVGAGGLLGTEGVGEQVYQYLVVTWIT